MTKIRGFMLALLLIVSASIIFSNLGGIPLLDPDEPVYAETPREMLLYDEFISPRIYGEYWYDKPPLYYWLVAATYKVFGVSDFAARFPSALLALACVGALYYFAGRIFNRRVGTISAFVLATSIEFFYLGKAAVTDITLTLFFTLALLSFITKKYWAFYLCTGLAVLTKGPIGLFPAVIAVAYLIITRNLGELKHMRLGRGAIIFAVIALPWYAVMYHLHGSAFIETFLGFHNITRFTSPEHPLGTLWYFYIPVLIVGFFPWNALLFQSIFHSLTQARDKFNELIFLNLWVLLVFLFFTVAQTKLVSYILPMYPGMAILVGWHIDHLWAERYRSRRQYAWGMIIALLCTGFGVGSYYGIQAIPALADGVYMLIGVLAFLLIATLVFLWRKNIGMACGATIISMTAMAFVVSYALFPAAAPDFSSRQTVQEFKTVYDGKSPIYVSKFLRPGFAFYSGQYGQELYFSNNSAPDMEKLLSLHDQAYFVIRDMDYNRITESARDQLQLVKTVDNKLILTKKK